MLEYLRSLQTDATELAKMCNIEISIHFHLSRHSFGNTMVGSGVKVFTLSKLMGHRTMRTTLMYVNNSIDNVENNGAG